MGRVVVAVLGVRSESAEEVVTAAEPPGGAVDGEDLGVVQEAVDDRDGLDFVAEQLGLFGDALVAGDDHRGAGVAAVDQLEEPVRVAVFESEVANLVDDQDVRALVVGELLAQRPELVGLSELADDVVEGRVAHEVAGAERLHRHTNGNVCLPDSGRAQNQRRDLVLDEPERAELGEAFGVELGLEADVEFIEGLVVRQPGELQPRRVAAAL